ncbi:MAG: hypothetical protein AAF547_02640 [Actinomycetota bacterium]
MNDDELRRRLLGEIPDQDERFWLRIDAALDGIEATGDFAGGPPDRRRPDAQTSGQTSGPAGLATDDLDEDATIHRIDLRGDNQDRGDDLDRSRSVPFRLALVAAVVLVLGGGFLAIRLTEDDRDRIDPFAVAAEPPPGPDVPLVELRGELACFLAQAAEVTDTVRMTINGDGSFQAHRRIGDPATGVVELINGSRRSTNDVMAFITRYRGPVVEQAEARGWTLDDDGFSDGLSTLVRVDCADVDAIRDDPADLAAIRDLPTPRTLEPTIEAAPEGPRTLSTGGIRIVSGALVSIPFEADGGTRLRLDLASMDGRTTAALISPSDLVLLAGVEGPIDIVLPHSGTYELLLGTTGDDTASISGRLG